eukprot:6167100-Lingulodinium_polyedra.AAC.1
MQEEVPGHMEKEADANETPDEESIERETTAPTTKPDDTVQPGVSGEPQVSVEKDVLAKPEASAVVDAKTRFEAAMKNAKDGKFKPPTTMQTLPTLKAP